MPGAAWWRNESWLGSGIKTCRSDQLRKKAGGLGWTLIALTRCFRNGADGDFVVPAAAEKGRVPQFRNHVVDEFSFVRWRGKFVDTAIAHHKAGELFGFFIAVGVNRRSQLVRFRIES